MNKLTVTLKQHTPLIHFQHDQEGATLRASEVKPKLDKFILTKLGEGDYQQGINTAKENKWLVGKGEHPALNYKMRIKCSNPVDINLPIKEVRKGGVVQRDELGSILFTTENYPDNMNSLIMGNMGGRIKEDVLNFVLYYDIKMIIISKKNTLIDEIKNFVFTFFVENGFGNRTSKGFGSYTVDKIDNNKCEEKHLGDWVLSFSINAESDEEISIDKAYRDIFVAINKMWKGLKRYGKSNKDGLKSVFLGRKSILKGNEDRIPSPLIFKPIINSQQDDGWNVRILALLNETLIDRSGASMDDFYDLIDDAVKEANLNDEYKNNYSISNIKLK